MEPRFPTGPDWLHEIKHDGYRLIVKRVRLFSRNGHDWSARYPLIVEAALCNRQTSFVIDGEAILLGVDGISDFNSLHSRKLAGKDLRERPLHLQEQSRAAAGAADIVEMIDLRGSRRIDRGWQARNMIDAGRWFVLSFYCNFADGKEAPQCWTFTKWRSLCRCFRLRRRQRRRLRVLRKPHLQRRSGMGLRPVW
jgi:hypothetical protein